MLDSTTNYVAYILGYTKIYLWSIDACYIIVQRQTTPSQTLAHGSGSTCFFKCKRFSILYHATKLFFIAYEAYNDMTMQLSRWPKTNCNSCFNSRVFLGNKTTCYILKQRTCHMKIPVGYIYGMESSSLIDMSDDDE